MWRNVAGRFRHLPAKGRRQPNAFTTNTDGSGRDGCPALASQPLHPNAGNDQVDLECRRGHLGCCDRGQRSSNQFSKEEAMLWTISVILLVLYFLGLVTSYTLGGFIHILLVLAVVVLVIRLLQGRKVV